VWLIFPVCNLTAPAECPRFPLISYAHGLAGGDIDLLGYAQHFYELASYGFVVAAPDSCDFGCTDPSNGAPYTDCAGTPPLPPVGENWPPWYGEQLKAIEWARNQTANATGDAVFATIDWDAGVGIAGHSMGGQATAMSASPACAARWGVRAAVLHHPADGELPAGGGHIGVNMSVPVASFTSSGDSIWPETVAYMAAANASEYDVPRAYRDLTGSSHLEPVLVPPVENPFLATFTAAWFKVFLNGDRGAWYDLVFGGGADSLCRHAPMTGCYVLNTP
jgi:dienelactone hydrolase